MSDPDSGSLPPEGELLLAACDVRDTETRRSRVAELVTSPLDWGSVTRLALKNRIVPMVYEAVRQVGFDRIPEADLSELEAYNRLYQVRNLWMLHELVELIGFFAKHGIEAVPYKGPMLALSLYDHPGLRQFYDLDILVRGGDLERALGLMEEFGYEPVSPMSAAEQAKQIASDCEFHYRRPGGDLTVEVHWQALPQRHRFGLDIDDYWERLVPMELAGVKTRGFGPEDLLLVLCIHGGEKHCWVRLQMLADVARILDRHSDDLDWELLFERARSIDREHTVLLGVFLAGVLLGAPMPSEIRSRSAQYDGVTTQAGITLGRILREDSGMPTYAKWQGYMRTVQVLSGGDDSRRPGGFWTYLGTVMTPEWKDRQALELPPSLSFLYYAYRPLRLVRSHGANLLKRIYSAPEE